MIEPIATSAEPDLSASTIDCAAPALDGVANFPSHPALGVARSLSGRRWVWRRKR